ncbi:MAG TPA: histidine phosphatase family protein [Polyangiaceae bacterium]|nr:histidine phosphatase family protein [Polyangiaceae bacterium]
MVKRALAWIRHGEYAQPHGVPSAHLPHGLTARGREQARAAAHGVLAFAREHELELHPVVDCSSLRRAWETADLLRRELTRIGGPALALEELPALAERSLGAAANLSVDEIEAALSADPRFEAPPRGWKREPGYRLPLLGAESLEEAGARVARHVAMRMRALAGGAQLKLFIGHGGAFRHAARALGLLSPDGTRRCTMQHAAPLYFEHEVLDDGLERFVHVAGEWLSREDWIPGD